MTTDGIIYFKDGDLISEKGSARLYKMQDELFLELGKSGTHTLWALESEIHAYAWQINDKPLGACLEIGLGLGVASRYILSCPKVKSLTTVEINKDVIAVHKDVTKIKGDWYGYNKTKKKHIIVNASGLAFMYTTKSKYDFIFLDFYDRIDEDTLPQIEDMAIAAKRILAPGGKVMGWFDEHTPTEFTQQFFGLF